MFSGLFASEHKKNALFYTAEPGLVIPIPPRAERNRYEDQSGFAFHRAGSDCRPAPSSAGRGSLSTTLPIRLPRMGPRTPTDDLPLAQGRASAAGASLPPASQRVCGDHAKLLPYEIETVFLFCTVRRRKSLRLQRFDGPRTVGRLAGPAENGQKHPLRANGQAASFFRKDELICQSTSTI